VQVAFHALRTLAREAASVASIAWRQNGFRPSPPGGGTPRNLQGFKDGTNNIDVRDERALRRHVWIPGGEGPSWMRGGTYLVMRRIRMLLEEWDALGRARQELAVGRRKRSGAPLGGHHERDRVDLGRLDAHGQRLIPLGAHVRHASPGENGGVRILRRGYSYDDGLDAATGTLDAGLFFLSFQRSPQAQTLRLLRRLATYDRLGEFTRHVASGVYACPPGARPGGFVGEGLIG
jgi:deferrochelatase/peroxidase EfeB